MAKKQGKQEIRFIRKGGRVIPIRISDKKKFEKSGKKDLIKRGFGKPTKKITRKEAGSTLRQRSKREKKLASTGRKVGTISAAVGLAFGFKKRFTAAGLAGGLSLLNFSFAAGKEASSEQAIEDARALEQGKKLKRSLFIGPSPRRTRKLSKFLQKHIGDSSV